MKSPQKCLFILFLALAAGFAQAQKEPEGRWNPPSSDGRPWKHDPTQIAFPPMLAGYRMAGHFKYEENGVLVRYENLEEQARLDVFLFKLETPLPTLEDKHRRLLMEMDVVTQDLETMEKQGRYKNVNTSEVTGGELDLWQKQSIPLATRSITATRIGFSSSQGAAEAPLSQWVGITVLDDYLITIRHMRPASTGDAGQQGMQNVIGLIFQLIKDPSLRSHIRTLVDDYLAEPFSEHGEQAAAAVLAYLRQTPYFPIAIPEDPVAGWLEHVKQVAPGMDEVLLRAFMLGSARAAFAGADAETCLKEGARQFALIYRQVVKKTPDITRPEMEAFVAAAEKGEGHIWLKGHSLTK